MTAKLIDGLALSQTLRADVATRAAALTARGHQPGLAVVLVGDNPASEVYVRNKIKACHDNGLGSSFDRYPADLPEAELLARIDELNRDPRIHGILVQLPLPKHIDSHKVIEAIAPEKDVDGFHVANAGALMTGQPLFRPCTPYGVMKMLAAYEIPLQGANAVVIGRSNIVGKPMALLLLEAGATVTICHSKTRDLAAHTRHADVVVAATGPAQHSDGGNGQAGRGGDRRRHESRRSRQAVRRRRFRGRQGSGRLYHAGAGRRRPDDHHDAAGQHDRSRRARSGRERITLKRKAGGVVFAGK
ncbi:5,10-methylene-tetrahydrofolate dehydrogenase/methenyl tetrahydrofolate cyclohydrolase [Paraburkholderia bryophila]|uniref:Bifunctional protein FolD n=1 Tax=Paraburkholderia bryophila TaxID=420952 RepID=A0A7Y9W2Q0_9BURK|nr:5,10-methylene-tetrahydrofolate dehydrogenase/methenyl tetrahydrofolate cyclohydrolase [Paraburkholderia bryophila]